MFMQRLQRFFYGRYGGDQLNIALLAIGIVLTLCGSLFFRPLYLPADAVYVYALFRSLSRNIPARQRENQGFLRVWRPVGGFLSFQKKKFLERGAYKYFKCPSCGQRLRAPRGRGKIEVTCQKCHHVFQTKT